MALSTERMSSSSSRYQLDWDSTCIQIESNLEAVVRRGADLLGLPVGLRARPTREFPDISALSNGRVHRLETRERQWECDSTDDLLVHLLWLIGVLFLRKCHRLVLHCGGLLIDGKAILFTGPPRCGKSSLTFAGLMKGYPVIGDDMIVVEDTSVRPFPKPLKLRQPESHVLEAFQKLGIASSDMAQGWLEGEYRQVLGRRLDRILPYTFRAEADRIFLLERGQKTSVLPIAPEFALRSVLNQALPTEAPSLGIVRFLKTLWQRRRVFRLIVGDNDFEQALELMLEDPACSPKSLGNNR